MALVRGNNPVWWMPDLVGNPMDDTYYLFILSPTLPYIPLTVYHDEEGNIPWSQPIQMLANGTVPTDLYFDDSTFYRLEWRAGSSQSDTLVYLVDNYIPNGGGGNTPVEDSSNITDNQITNPQFSVVNFTGSYTSASSTISNIAPGWDIVTTGSSGSVTITQLEVTGTAGDSSNPSYALQIESSGWSTVSLRQTFSQNGALWAEDDVALQISAYNNSGTAPFISGSIIYSGSSTVTQEVFTSISPLNSAPNQYGGAATMPASVNTSDPSSSNTTVSFSWTSNNTIVVTSIQVLAGILNTLDQVAYQQSTIERQIDQTFHYYADSLIMQPKPSLLSGWKFSLNPWQFTTTTVTAVANNAYTADQTIVCQQAYIDSASADNVGVGKAAAADNYALHIKPLKAANKFALIQYIDPITISGYWGYTLSALLRLRFQNNNVTTGVKVKMRLIYSDTLPSALSQTYPIASWAANGDPVWDADFTTITPTNDPEYDISALSTMTELPFIGMTLPANTHTTKTLGIVIYTTGVMTHTGTADYIVVDDCSLVANDFPIASSVLTYDESLARCEFYYEKSYANGVLPGASSQLGAHMENLPVQLTSAPNFQIQYRRNKRIATPTVTIYEPAGTINEVHVLVLAGGTPIVNAASSISLWSQAALGDKAVTYVPANPGTPLFATGGSGIINGYIRFHYTIDARI